MGPDLLPLQHGRVPLRRVLHHQCVEHAEECGESCASHQARGRQLHGSITQGFRTIYGLN